MRQRIRHISQVLNEPLRESYLNSGIFFATDRSVSWTTSCASGSVKPEAQDVVQETLLSVAKKIPEFKYDSRKGSFKTWLMCLIRWRIANQFRKRQRRTESPRIQDGTSTRTAT